MTNGTTLSDIEFEVNGKTQRLQAHPMTRLLDVLRSELQLKGTKEGCGEGECGACAVLVDGCLVNSCLVPVVQVNGAQLRTIEDMSGGPELAALQHAFVTINGTQCGFCTPGMIVAAVELLERNSSPNDQEIREAMAGNLCRCTGYMKIVQAIHMASYYLAKKTEGAV